MSYIFDFFENERYHRNDLNKQEKTNLCTTYQKPASVSTNHAMNLNVLLEIIIDIINWRKSLFPDNFILIVANSGIANGAKLKFLLEDVLKIKGKYYKQNQNELMSLYESNEYKFIVYLGLDSGDFDRNKFRETCKNIKNLTAIICIENLNPRSYNLKGNIEELRYVFTSDELREKLYVFFTFGSSTKP
jgi:hypothetical protein